MVISPVSGAGAHSAARERTPNAWSRFWAARPVAGLYLVPASVLVVLSLLSHFGQGDGGSPRDPTALVIATVAFLLQWWRSTFAYALLVVAMVRALNPAGDGGSLVDPVLPLVLCNVAATARSRLFIGLALVSSAVWAVLVPVMRGGRPDATWFFLLLVVIGAGAGFGFRAAWRQSERDQRRIGEAERRAAEAAERERRILARDLHDIVAHNLTIIVMQAGAAQYAGTRQAAEDALQVIGESAGDALRDLRRMVGVLKADGAIEPGAPPGSAEAEDAATVATLRRGAEGMAAHLGRLGIVTRLDVGFGPTEPPLAVRAALYRVLQEAVTNVVKHAGPGERCSIAISADAGAVVLEVVNTVPADTPRLADNSSGMGLHSMRGRVETFGGTLEAGDDGFGRWRLRASVPVADAGGSLAGEV